MIKNSTNQKKINFKCKLMYKYRSNIWGRFGLKDKLKSEKWQDIYLKSTPLPNKRELRKPKHLRKLKALKKTYLRQSFRMKLTEKQKLRYFYGNPSTRVLKKFNKIAIKKDKYELTTNFTKILESKLDVILYRSNLITNIFQCKYLIRTGRILVNDKLIKNSNYLIKTGDIIKFNITKDQKIKLIENSVKNQKRFFRKDLREFLDLKQFIKMRHPMHLEINYQTLSIMLWANLNDKLIHKTIYRPSQINISSCIRYLKIKNKNKK